MDRLADLTHLCIFPRNLKLDFYALLMCERHRNQFDMVSAPYSLAFAWRSLGDGGMTSFTRPDFRNL
jgi:hypothetical protein